MIKYTPKKQGSAQGFTLIETLVAISILTITMGAPFFAVEQSITAADVSRDELTGSMLAQEGVEYIRSIRDGDYLYVRANPSSTQTWLYGLDGTDPNGNPSVSYNNCFVPYQCTVDPTALNSSPVQQYSAAATVPVLYINNGTFLYTQVTSGGAATVFTRSVQLTNISTTEVKVVVTVKWITRHIPYTTTITEYLDNWMP
jgi:prepilin-type N-terminal cleavage/methylation domain-containing protein